MDSELRQGDCREILPTLELGTARLAYFDPPFLTQKVQRLRPRDRSEEYSFSDLWSGHEQYAKFLYDCLRLLRRALAEDGSLVFHCDRRCSHIARAVLDDVFGARNFRSEIIWQYRRWSNARRALLPAHQTLYLYTKGSNYIFNPVYVEYSPATNVDQILQRRVRDAFGKAVYERDGKGQVVASGVKKGVPLGDVWDIPYLNPKAKERVGYPTQKPIVLLERIISLASEPGDLVLDPCCGSGTTLVAARLLGRRSTGIDSSKRAIALARRRLAEPQKTVSKLLHAGRESYRRKDPHVLSQLGALDLIPVHRNQGIDAILRQQYLGRPIALRVQRPDESPERAAQLLASAGKSKQCLLMLLVVTNPEGSSLAAREWPANIVAIESTAAQVAQLLLQHPGDSNAVLKASTEGEIDSVLAG